MSAETIWVAIAFTTFCAFACKHVVKAVKDGLNQYCQEVSKPLKEAEAIYEESKQRLTSLKQAIADAKESAEAMLKASREEVNAILEETRTHAESLADKRLDAIAEKIQQQEARIVEAIKSEVLELAISGVREKLESSLSDEEHIRIIENAIKGKKTIH